MSVPRLYAVVAAESAIVAANVVPDAVPSLSSRVTAPVIVPVKSNICNLYREAVDAPLPLTRSIERTRQVPISLPPEFSILIVPNVVISGTPVI